MHWGRVVGVLTMIALLASPVQATYRALQLLDLRATQLVYDGNLVIAEGNVEISYNDYILTADQVTYDQGADTLVAKGNAQLEEPNGHITRADRIDVPDDLRDEFVRWLAIPIPGGGPHTPTAPR